MSDLSNDIYYTIGSPCEGIFRDKGSKFIAYAFPFNQEDELKDVIAHCKSLHPKARHHCWAYRLSPDREVYRINDDGEPSGTAGRPILNELLSSNLTNIMVVVVRYFGGTLLGVPGLINAYKSATQDCISNAEIVEKTIDEVFDIFFEYPNMNDVMRLIKDYDWKVLEQQFEIDCRIRVAIRQSEVKFLKDRFKDLIDIKYSSLQG